MNQTSIQKEDFEDLYRLAQHWLEGVIQQLEVLGHSEADKSVIDKSILEKAEAMLYVGLMYEHGFGV